MKNCIRKMLGIFAIVLCLVAVQAADAYEIEGTIDKVYSVCAIDVVIGDTDTKIKVQGLRFNYLFEECGIQLTEGDKIILEVFDVVRAIGTMTFACELVKLEDTVWNLELRDCQ